MKKSWKTTVAGLITLGAALVPVAFPQYADICTKVVAAATAAGLLAARDNNVTSKQAGAE